jgi:hypothetical protein
MWNGTAEILKATPASRNTMPKISPIERFSMTMTLTIWSSWVVPVKPYSSEAP